MNITNDAEKYLGGLLQSLVSFEIDSKSIKRGKVILFAIKDFHIHFVIQSDKKEHKQFIIPLPFNILIYDNTVILDYTLEALSRGNIELLYKLKVINRKKNTRFYNTKMCCRLI